MRKGKAIVEVQNEDSELIIRAPHDYQSLNPAKNYLISYGDTEDDSWSAADAAEGVQIFGGTGSGKTSGSGKTIAYSYLNSQFGGLVLAVKQDEVENWKRYCRETGRENDLIIFSPENIEQCSFNFLEYEINRGGRGAGNVDNIVSLFLDVLEIAGRKKDTGNSNNPFFDDTLKQLLTNTIELIILSGSKTLNLINIKDIISSSAHQQSDLSTKEWQEGACAKYLYKANANVKSDSSLTHDFSIIKQYWIHDFPKLAQQTRSIIEIMFSSMANIFLRRPMRDLFCNKTAITPDICGDGKIILIDMPVLEFNEAGLYANILWKLVWQRSMEKRKIDNNTQSVFLWADEAQYFINNKDQVFQTTARSQRICTVYLTQNIPNYISVLGEEETKSLLGNLNTKIFHGNTDKVTNEYASELLGRTYMDKWTYNESENEGTNTSWGTGSSSGEGGGSSSNNSGGGKSYGQSTGSSVTKELEYQILPEQFSSIGRSEYPPVVDGIVFQMGKSIWPISQANFLAVGFSQDNVGQLTIYNELLDIPKLTLKSFIRPSIIIKFLILWLITFVICSLFGLSSIGLFSTSVFIAALGAAYMARELHYSEFSG